MKKLLICVLAAAALVPVRAQEAPMGGLVLPGPGGAGSPGDFARYRFDDAFGRAGQPTIIEQRLEANVVVSSTPVDNWSVQERFGHFGMSAPVQIPGGQAVPRSLWSESAGARYTRDMEAGRSWGVSGSVGSDSDVLFHSMRETTFSATIDAKVPSGERDAWLFFLNYSNNRYFLNNVPLPGVAYQFRNESGTLRGVAGFPFVGLFWMPEPLVDARLLVFGPRRVYADAGYRLVDVARLHGGFDWSGETWLPVGRSQYNDQLQFERKRAYVGVETPLPGRLRLDVTGGRQFDQKFYENDANSASAAKATLPPSWFLSAALSWRFGREPHRAPRL